MADFLSRLAARALGATPVAEPVLPARFSPAAEHISLSPFPSAVQTVPAAPSNQLRPARQAEPPTAQSASRHSARPEPAFGDVDDKPQPKRPGLTRSSHLHHFAAPAVPFSTQPQTGVDAKNTGPDATRAHIVQHHGLNDRPEASTSRDSQSKAPSVAAQAAFAEPRPPRHFPSLSPPVRAGEQPGPSSRSLIKPAVPTVRVTIGCIEVRAEMAAPAPARSAAARTRPAHVSLDQFLRQSGGGSR